MPSRPITNYLDARRLEWLGSAYLILQGATILTWPNSSHGSILQVLIGNIGAIQTALLFLFVGLVGAVALVVNGRSLKIGPHVRSLASIVRMVIWASFTLAMYRISRDQGFPSPMAIFFALVTIAEAYTPYRAVLDVRPGS
jgi:uncharacterized membrane protein YeaQ/YmgE (transglycosylase-associated protein family)